MLPSNKVVTSAIEKMYDATATIYVQNPTQDKYGAYTRLLTKVLTSVRCRIAYKRIFPVVTEDVVDKDIQKITLIYTTNSAVQIPDGSKIVVLWDDGRTDTFQNSGLPKVYQFTTQVPLERMAVKP